MDVATLNVTLPGLPLHQAVVTLVQIQIVNADATRVVVLHYFLVPVNITTEKHTAITRQIYAWGVQKGVTELLVAVFTIMDLVLIAHLCIISTFLEHLLAILG
jgi:hypothetical protein